MSEAFYILFKDGPPKDWARAAEVVLKAGIGLGRADATRACRFGHGLLPVPLHEDRAKMLAATLDAANLGALALPVSRIAEVPDAYATHSGTPDADGFRVQVDARGTLRDLPWASIRVVNVAYVKPGGRRLVLPREPIVVPETPRDVLLNDSLAVDPGSLIATVGLTMVGIAAGVAVGSSAGARMVVREVHKAVEKNNDPFLADASLVESPPASQEPEVWLELFTFEPLFRLRIRQRAFKYDYLGARRMPNTRGNFKLLVADILKFAPHALRIKHALAASTGVNLEQERFLEEEPAYELSLMVILTRAMMGMAG